MNKEIFIKTIVPLRGKLLSVARRYIEDEEEVQDIVQEVFAKLWMIREELYKYDSLIALSIRITQNLCLNQIKREQLRISVFEQIYDESQSVYDSADNKEKVEYLHNIVAQLPNLQQLIFRMKYVDDMDVNEIATLLGCSHEAVWMNLSRARKKVKDMFCKKEMK